MQKKESVLRVIKETVRKHGVLSAALLGVVCGAVIFALLPPLVLAQLIDLLTKKHTLWMEGILLYFGLLALTGLLESARESLLTVFGQKITHALRSSLMEKFGRLSANELNRQEPGALVSRFVGDVDTVENLFTSGIISMFADACKILSILVVIWLTNRGLTIVLIILLPVLFLFTRYVQKNCWHPRLPTAARSAVLPATFRRRCTTFGPSTACRKRRIWSSSMRTILMTATAQWRRPIFTMPSILRSS